MKGGKPWKDTLKSYLAEMNRTYADGEYQRLSRFFKDEENKKREAARWQREREQREARGAIPLSVKMVAKPLYTATFGANDQEQEVEAAISLYHQLVYQLGADTYLQENQRVQKIRMKWQGDEWAFLWPWGWYFEQHHLQDLPPVPEQKTPQSDQVQEVSMRPVQGGYDRGLSRWHDISRFQPDRDCQLHGGRQYSDRADDDAYLFLPRRTSAGWCGMEANPSGQPASFYPGQLSRGHLRGGD